MGETASGRVGESFAVIAHSPIRPFALSPFVCFPVSPPPDWHLSRYLVAGMCFPLAVFGLTSRARHEDCFVWDRFD